MRGSQSSELAAWKFILHYSLWDTQTTNIHKQLLPSFLQIIMERTSLCSPDCFNTNLAVTKPAGETYVFMLLLEALSAIQSVLIKKSKAASWTVVSNKTIGSVLCCCRPPFDESATAVMVSVIKETMTVVCTEPHCINLYLIIIL